MQGAGKSAGNSEGNRSRQTSIPQLPEEWLQLVLESAKEYGIFTFDLNGRVTWWNSGAERILGYREDEIVGQKSAVIFTPEDRATHQPELEMEQALKEGRAEDERWHLRKDGSRFWGSGIAMPLRGEQEKPRGVLKILRDLTERKRAEDALKQSEALLLEARDTLEQRVRERTEELEEANKQLEEQIRQRERLERATLESAEREQRRIGQQLHDTVCQELAGLSFSAKALARGLVQSCPEHAKEADRLGDLLRASVDGMRQVARGLYPIELQRGGVMTALQELAAAADTSVKCNFECTDVVLLANPTVSLHLYRIAQEAVTNALRHAGAKKIEITLIRDGSLTLVVEDDGCGFVPGHAGENALGLELMRYRAAVAGGTLRISSEPGKGTVVTCALPWQLDDQITQGEA